MAQPITLQQLNDWLRANRNKTWYNCHIGNADYDGGFSGKPGATPLIKYVWPRFDCRDYEIYQIEFSGSFPSNVIVSERDPFEGNLLELFESKFPEEFKKS